MKITWEQKKNLLCTWAIRTIMNSSFSAGSRSAGRLEVWIRVANALRDGSTLRPLSSISNETPSVKSAHECISKRSFSQKCVILVGISQQQQFTRKKEYTDQRVADLVCLGTITKTIPISTNFYSLFASVRIYSSSWSANKHFLRWKNFQRSIRLVRSK